METKQISVENVLPYIYTIKDHSNHGCEREEEEEVKC